MFSSGSYPFGEGLCIRGKKHCPLQLSLSKAVALTPSFSVLFFINICVHQELCQGLRAVTELIASAVGGGADKDSDKETFSGQGGVNFGHRDLEGDLSGEEGENR